MARDGWPKTWVAALDMAFLSQWKIKSAYQTLCGGSSLRRRVVESVKVRSVGRRALHLPPDPHIKPERNRHDDRGTDSQNEEPPEHPHNALRIADGQLRECARNDEARSAAVKPSRLAWPALCGDSQHFSRRAPDACEPASIRWLSSRCWRRRRDCWFSL